MAFIWIDSVLGTITKYTAVALIAGSIGYCKGCQHGREIGMRNHTHYIENLQKEEYNPDYSIKQMKINKAKNEPDKTSMNELEKLLGGE